MIKMSSRVGKPKFAAIQTVCLHISCFLSFCSVSSTSRDALKVVIHLSKMAETQVERLCPPALINTSGKWDRQTGWVWLAGRGPLEQFWADFKGSERGVGDIPHTGWQFGVVSICGQEIQSDECMSGYAWWKTLNTKFGGKDNICYFYK